MTRDFALTDAELCRFLDVGYHIVDTSAISNDTHERLFEAASTLHQQRAELSNPLASLDAIADNLHVQVPALNEVLACNALDGALTSVLGANYFRYGHSFIHLSGQYDQSYHKDSPLPWGTRGGVRSHRPNWAMVFYYPQAVTIDMGATEILPGTQYWNVDREDSGRTEGEDRLDPTFQQESMNAMDEDSRDRHLHAQLASFDRDVEPMRLVLPQGALVLVHFDLFHRGTRATSNDARYMYKFWYVRTTEPKQSSSTPVFSYAALDPRRQVLVAKQAAWLGLEVDAKSRNESVDFDETQEADRLSQAHKSMQSDSNRVISACSSDAEAERRSAMYALVGCDAETREATPALVASPHTYLRRCGAFLLGELTRPTDAEVKMLIAFSVDDVDTDVRMTAMNAVGRALRRNISRGVIALPTELCMAWTDHLLIAPERVTRSGLVQSAERQCMYTALLNIVTSLLVEQAHPSLANDIAELICHRVLVETDRYAKSTALETVSRLAELGHSKALTTSLRLLRNERWSIVSTAA
ncbi:MAG: hypothetical protein F4W90_04735 [Gammaproteobacteria bacterium]|nr:hypothetical protein [Gammaproteobacteria bacterium]